MILTWISSGIVHTIVVIGMLFYFRRSNNLLSPKLFRFSKSFVTVPDRKQLDYTLRPHNKISRQLDNGVTAVVSSNPTHLSSGTQAVALPGFSHIPFSEQAHIMESGADQSALATIGHDHHRREDAPLNEFFESSRYLANLLSLTYRFVRSHMVVDAPWFGHKFTDEMIMGTAMAPTIKHLKWALHLVNSLPGSVSGRVVPGWPSFLELKRVLLIQVAQIQATAGDRQMEAKAMRRPFEAVPARDAGLPLAELEQLTCLRAVIKESPRLGFETSGYLPRIAPNEILAFVDKKQPDDLAQWEPAPPFPPGFCLGRT
ncbi:hypothetical protein BJ170DRAFT_720425 [Xylariales sp. AK1849]|nr:hypothetical protein BJ170DRAFT_720425 [Xylariales sp. AK1849]